MQHIYETQITTEDNLQTVLKAINNFSFDRFLCALRDRKTMSVSEILALDATITEATSKLKQEYAKLTEAAPNFNKRFVHKNNHYFSSTQAILYNIRSGVSRFKQVYAKLTPNNAAKVQQLHCDVRPSLYNRSALGNAEYYSSLFPDTLRPEVKQLYEDMVAFLSMMEDALVLCQDVIQDENKIRKDPMQCLDLYVDFKREHYFHIKQLLKQITASWNSVENMTNPAIELRESAASEEDFSQQGFHNLEFDDVCTLATKEIVEESQRGEFTKEELILFQNDKQKILQVRYIITHFDTFISEQHQTHKKIPAKYIAALLLWAEPKEDLAFVKYFRKLYTENNTTYQVPDNPSVNVQKNTLNSSDKEYHRLVVTWNNIKM